MLKNELTLLIHSCDKFSDLWDSHIKLLERNWSDRNLRTLILTDRCNNKYFSNVEIISAGDGKEITERIRYMIPLIHTEYVLVTLDDYFPIMPIDSKRIERLIDIMKRQGYDYMRLYHRPKGAINKTADDDIYTYSLDKDYRVNLYAGIWRKDFIERTLGDESLNAWEFEVTLTERARNAGGKCAVSYGKEFPILDVVRKGQILPHAWRYLKKHDLYNGNRPRMPYKDYIILGVKTISNRLLAKLPSPVYQTVKNLCVGLGMNSYSARVNRK